MQTTPTPEVTHDPTGQGHPVPAGPDNTTVTPGLSTIPSRSAPVRLSFTSDWKPAAACPQAWHAERVARVWPRKPKPCFATGSLFHAALLTPDRIPAVYAEYGDLLTLKRASKGAVAGEPNASAREALADAEYTRALPEVADLLSGARCEVEVRFDLDEVPWVAHVDCITAGDCVLDAKTCRDVTVTEWCPVRKCRVPWHEAMLYWHQLAIYRRAVNAEAVAILACQHVPEDVPEVRIIERAREDDDILDRLASDIAWSMRHEWQSPVTGRMLPPFVEMLDARTQDLPRCEQPDCSWCRHSRTDHYWTYSAPRERGL